MLNEREFELINILGEDLGVNQRQISCRMGMSLGVINMLIRRLVIKGIIRIEQLNKRKVKYLLTSKGFSEKMRKSVRYTLKTIKSIGLIKEGFTGIIQKLYDEGIRNFYIYSKADLFIIIERIFVELDLKKVQVKILKDYPKERLDGILLIAKEDISIQKIHRDQYVDIIHEISKHTVYD